MEKPTIGDIVDRPAALDVRELQAKLYREIGISAVAAALRFTTQPEPARRDRVPFDPAPQAQRDRTLAA